MTRRPNAARWAQALVVVSSLTVTACGAARLALPATPGMPAADAADAFAQATSMCQGITTFSAELAVSGRVAGRRLRARLLAGTATPASMFLDAPAPFGASVFQLAARGDEATLILPRDRRVLERGRPDAVLEAMTGVPLSPADLHQALTGCVPAIDASGGREAGDLWRIIPGEQETYLHRVSAAAPWQLLAVIHRPVSRPAWRAEYRDFANGLPRTIQLVSEAAGRFDLRVALSQIEINAALDVATFVLRVPPEFAPITLDELREAGPLAEPDR